jgi:hypothetical protein
LPHPAGVDKLIFFDFEDSHMGVYVIIMDDASVSLIAYCQTT